MRGRESRKKRGQRPLRVLLLTFAATFAAARTASSFFVALPLREAGLRERAGRAGDGSLGDGDAALRVATLRV